MSLGQVANKVVKASKNAIFRSVHSFHKNSCLQENPKYFIDFRNIVCDENKAGKNYVMLQDQKGANKVKEQKASVLQNRHKKRDSGGLIMSTENDKKAPAQDKKIDTISVRNSCSQDYGEDSACCDVNQNVTALPRRDLDSSRTLMNHQVSSDEITSMPSDICLKYSPLSTHLDDYIDMMGPPMISSFNFAAYVNHSETLKQLVNLGVDLFQIEKHKDTDIPQKILQLDFESQVTPFIQFLNDLRVPPNEFGPLISKNPQLLFENLDDLHTRVNYLKSKKFSVDSIAQIIYKAPLWLTFTSKDIDMRLGILQKMFSLTGNQLRDTICGYPKVVTYSVTRIQLISFSVKDEMGFTDLEMKAIFMKKPRIWKLKKATILASFDYLHNEMKLSHETLVQFPEILCTRKFKLEQRHVFLKNLDKAQYDPSKPLYVSLKALISGTDGEFSVGVAKKPVQVYNEFLKTR